MNEPSRGAPHICGPLGILSGGGRLPLDIAAAAVAAGRGAHIVAIEDFASPQVAGYPHEWVNLGQLGRILASLRRAGCRDLVIAGALQRPDLKKLRFDFGALRRLPILLRLTRGGDDSVLRRVVTFFEAEGFTVRGVGDVAPHLLAGAGTLGAVAPSAAHVAMIDRAARFISAIGPFDVGQAVVMSGEGVVAVEGVRGTDAMLRDLSGGGAGEGRGHGGVLVKFAKPTQEMRIDLPTIGPDTITAVTAAGLAGLAVGAGSAIMIERQETLRRADGEGVFVMGADQRRAEQPEAGARAALPPTLEEMMTWPVLSVVSRRAPTPADRRDIAVGRRLMPVLRAHGAGKAAVIVREHVLAVAGALPVDRVVAGLGRTPSWGRRTFLGQIGVLALDIADVTPDAVQDLPTLEVFRAAMTAGLAGIVCLGGPIPEAVRADLIGWAKDAKIFLMAEEPLQLVDDLTRDR
jgi:UDP-2,3-diacylglucosamine hydrolase